MSASAQSRTPVRWQDVSSTMMLQELKLGWRRLRPWNQDIAVWWDESEMAEIGVAAAVPG